MRLALELHQLLSDEATRPDLSRVAWQYVARALESMSTIVTAAENPQTETQNPAPLACEAAAEPPAEIPPSAATSAEPAAVAGAPEAAPEAWFGQEPAGFDHLVQGPARVPLMQQLQNLRAKAPVGD